MTPSTNDTCPRDAPIAAGREFLIYGKHATQRRFRPMDLHRGVQVVNLIYASRLTAQERDRFLADAPRDNPEWRFEARRG